MRPQLLSVGLLASSMSTFSLAAGQDLTRRQTEAADLANAQDLWRQDTSTVSQFLSTAATFTGADLVSQAQVALSAEQDELNHKAVIDSFFSADPTIAQANGVLVGMQTFNMVVMGLQQFVDQGAGFSTDDTNNLVGIINQVRCTMVLPAIDQYFQVVGNFLQNGATLLANRPDNCPSGSKKRNEL